MHIERLESRTFLSGNSASYFDIGAPVLTDLWVDPVHGNDSAAGSSRATALRTIGSAWDHIPSGAALTTGYRINLVAGTYPFDEGRNNWYSDITGTLAHPVILSAADGRGTVHIEGGMNIANTRYLYLMDVSFMAGGPYHQFANNVLHFENSSYVVMRGINAAGPDPAAYPANDDIQEVIKANQCDHFYLEDSDISGTYQTTVDYFSVQYGHVLDSSIHGSGGWGMYVKGGSAYLNIDGNDFFGSETGFQAGEGSNLEVMRSPWLNYEAYDIKFVNNLVHDLSGVGVSAAGAYNFLVANNTLYRVGTTTDAGRSFPMMQFVHGFRDCTDTSENGVGNAHQICQAFLDQGGWGPSTPGEDGEWIPNQNIYVYNNILYNPAPTRTLETDFWIQGPASPPAYTNIPSPSLADNNLQIKGNIIWNGPADMPLGLDNASALTDAQLIADNTINQFEPALADPANGDYYPAASGNVFSVTPVPVPDFTWDGLPPALNVPTGTLTNIVPADHDANARDASSPPGAFTVRSGNRAPVAATDTATVQANSSDNTIDVLANDHDPDNDAISVFSVGVVAHGIASISGNSIHFTPTPGYSGPASFSYVVHDEHGASGTATVNITVQSPPADRTAPASVLQRPTITSGTRYLVVKVVYTDATGVKASSLASGNLQLTGPRGYKSLATLYSITPAGNGKSLTATYKFAAPGGTWDRADNGTYTVTLLGSKVRDILNNFAPKRTLGTVVCSIARKALTIGQ